MNRTVVSMLGDSVTAGYGLRPHEALPSRLQAHLEMLGRPTSVLNAGVSGDTTADGLRRVDRDIPSESALCIVALGANDMMQLVAPSRVERHLDAILERLKSRSIPALICGMRAPPWFGLYAVGFDAVFAAAARRHQAAYYPFLLEGIALDPTFISSDRLHPNAQGIDVVAQRLAPVVASALRPKPD